MQYLRLPTLSSLAFRLALTNFLMNLAGETSAVLLPLYSKDKGASNLQVGLIVAAYGSAYFLSSLIFGRLSDIHGRVKFIRIGLGFSAIAYFLQIMAASPMVLLATRALVGLCLGITAAAMTAFTFEHQKEIARFSSFGALGVFFGAIIAAALANYYALFIVSSIASVAAFSITISLKEAQMSPTARSLSPMPILKSNFRIYFGFFIRQLGGFAIWSIFPLYLSSIGASKFWIAVMDAINTGGQFIAIRIVQKYEPTKIFRIGFIISILVFIIYGLANNYLQLIPVQIVLAIAYSCLYMGAFNYLLIHNAERGTASGLLYSSSFLANGLGPYLGGSISQIWGYSAVMYLGAALTSIGLIASKGLSSRGKQLVNR